MPPNRVNTSSTASGDQQKNTAQTIGSEYDPINGLQPSISTSTNNSPNGRRESRNSRKSIVYIREDQTMFLADSKELEENATEGKRYAITRVPWQHEQTEHIEYSEKLGSSGYQCTFPIDQTIGKHAALKRFLGKITDLRVYDDRQAMVKVA